MMEHLDRTEARAFLLEAKRVLCVGGWLRLSVPDLSKHVSSYLEHHDADRFMAETLVGTTRARTVLQWVRHVVLGPRHHLWMYDGGSLKRFVESIGFAGVQIMREGVTNIPDPGPLDTRERMADSVVVEARRP